jgi:hypothetical protein
VCHAGHEVRLGGVAKFVCDCGDQANQHCGTGANKVR